MATSFVLIGAGVRPFNREWPSAVTSLSANGDDDASKLTMLVVLLTIAPAQARERWYLKGINSVSYMGIVELKTAHCDFDMKA